MDFVMHRCGGLVGKSWAWEQEQKIDEMNGSVFSCMGPYLTAGYATDVALEVLTPNTAYNYEEFPGEFVD
jgi:hypothetical protein